MHEVKHFNSIPPPSCRSEVLEGDSSHQLGHGSVRRFIVRNVHSSDGSDGSLNRVQPSTGRSGHLCEADTLQSLPGDYTRDKGRIHQTLK